MQTANSNKLYHEALKIIPGGVNSPVRAFKSVNIEPIFVKSAKGSRITDVDENTYIDYIGSWGPALLGHANEIVYEGVYDALMRGSSYGLPTEIEIEMAMTIIEAIPSIEMVRMVNSGTEATMSALRVARGFTGRDKILKFEGCYHGHSDGLLVKTGSGALTFNIPTSAGIPKEITQSTLVGEFNNVELLEKIFEEHKGEIAAVIIEPIPANMGIVKPDLEFLKRLREITLLEGTVLIFDEVITGFRIAYGGAQEFFGIDADLTCLGKIIGGGMPVGAYGGKREIMEMVSPVGSVYQAGTLSGNPIAMKMGLNTLRYLREHREVYGLLEAKAIMLEEGFSENIEIVGIKGTVNRIGSLMSMFFVEGQVRNYYEVMQADTKKYADYFNQMLQLGIMLPPAQFEAMFLSIAHSEDDIERTILAHRKAVGILGK